MELMRIPSPLHYARSYRSGLADPGARRLGLSLRRVFDAPNWGVREDRGDRVASSILLRENHHFMGMRTGFVVLRGLV